MEFENLLNGLSKIMIIVENKRQALKYLIKLIKDWKDINNEEKYVIKYLNKFIDNEDMCRILYRATQKKNECVINYHQLENILDFATDKSKEKAIRKTRKEINNLTEGINYDEEEINRKCDDYLDFVINKHKIYQPQIQEIDRYHGIKTEITFKNQERGYLYNIINNSENVWSLIPGKFTLAFSMAPEFYRRVFNKNPKILTHIFNI